MMSLSQIHELSDSAARKARRHDKRPYIVWPGDTERMKSFPFPFLGSYTPKGWKLVETYFVDATGLGNSNEPALTIDAFRSKLKPGMGYAIVEAGQFQVVVGEYSPPKTKVKVSKLAVALAVGGDRDDKAI